MTSFVTIFGAKVSYQSLIMLIVGFVAAIALLFAGVPGMILSAFVLIITSVNAYTINCTIVGNCKVFSYFLLVLNIIGLLLIVVTAYMKRPVKVAEPQVVMATGGRKRV